MKITKTNDVPAPFYERHDPLMIVSSTRSQHDPRQHPEHRQHTKMRACMSRSGEGIQDGGGQDNFLGWWSVSFLLLVNLYPQNLFYDFTEMEFLTLSPDSVF